MPFDIVISGESDRIKDARLPEDVAEKQIAEKNVFGGEIRSMQAAGDAPSVDTLDELVKNDASYNLLLSERNTLAARLSRLDGVDIPEQDRLTRQAVKSAQASVRYWSMMFDRHCAKRIVSMEAEGDRREKLMEEKRKLSVQYMKTVRKMMERKRNLAVGDMKLRIKKVVAAVKAPKASHRKKAESDE